jgi:hypothetical protein
MMRKELDPPPRAGLDEPFCWSEEGSSNLPRALPLKYPVFPLGHGRFTR